MLADIGNRGYGRGHRIQRPFTAEHAESAEKTSSFLNFFCSQLILCDLSVLGGLGSKPHPACRTFRSSFPPDSPSHPLPPPAARAAYAALNAATPSRLSSRWFRPPAIDGSRG